MSQSVYIDQILRPYVKEWIDNGDSFILEEDRDSGHGPNDNYNKVRKYKNEIGLDFYFNSPKSPDISVIESSFQPLKQFLAHTGHFDIETLKQRAEKGWNEHLSQAFINKQVQGMEDRIYDLLDGDGRMTGH